MSVFTLWFSLYYVIGQAQPRENPWKINLNIVDESGSPVVAAKVWLEYGTSRNGASSDLSQATGWAITGLTDKYGAFSGGHTDSSHGLRIRIEDDGYYSSALDYPLYLPSQFDGQQVFANRNPNLTLVIKKIGHPIAMYARHAKTEIPEINVKIGYDLIQADWVAPYGKGKSSDMVFEAQKRWISRKDFDSSVEISFPNKGDGIISVHVPLQQASQMRMGATAPAEGYLQQVKKNLSHTPANGWKDDEREGNKDQNYYLRIRTKLDENGNVKSALYGKMHGDFALDPINSKTVKIFFDYYINPTANSRNVEFDPKQNLFKRLTADENIDRP